MKACVRKVIYKRVLGFTLAEVLITLTIIGVIAALTIPVLISDVQKNMWAESMKKTVSALSQATNEIMLDNAGSLAGVFTSDDTMMSAYATKMGFTRTCLAGQNPGVCFHNGTASWHNLQGDSGWMDPTSRARAVGGDGVLYRFWMQNSTCADSGFRVNGVNALCGWILFDVNGFKGPNTAGRDMFLIDVTTRGVVPEGTYGSTYYSSTWNLLCNPSSTQVGNGETCAHRVMQEGGMKY